MKTKSIFSLVILLSTSILWGQSVLETDKEVLEIITNGKKTTLELNFKEKNTSEEIESPKKKAKIQISDGKNTLVFSLKRGNSDTFKVINSQNKDTLSVKISLVEPIAVFSKDYIKKYQGKSFVEIPEVSELVNILMVLHRDAEKDNNMFDTKTEYYQRIKKHFAPYRNHPAVDTIQKYITKTSFNENLNEEVFPFDDYFYYYALKMNACAYEFDKKGNIKNKGDIKEMARGWFSFDPMKDAKVFADFAKVSNFKAFYRENEAYYKELITIYNQLNPIQQMQTWLDQKFGFGYGSYVVYFSPLVAGSHSTQGFEDNGFSQTFMFICKSEINPKKTLLQNEMEVSRIVFTEIDHNYVNPLSDTLIKEINDTFQNREKWAKGDMSSPYETPYNVFNEYMTFGLYSLYLNDHYPTEEVLKSLPSMENLMEKGRGFIRFKDFNRTLLKKYQENPEIPMKDLFLYMLEVCKSF